MPTPARRAMSSSDAPAPCSRNSASAAATSCATLRWASARSTRCARRFGDVSDFTIADLAREYLACQAEERSVYKRRMPPLNRARASFPVLIGTIAAATACGNSQSAPLSGGPPPPPAVGVAVIGVREVRPSDELTGRVEAVQHVDIRARVSGHVTAVAYREGAEVAKGALLFT